MLRKFNTNRTLADNIKLGGLTAFVAGMVNVASIMIFFAFTSNITGHIAVLAEEISKGNWYQVAIVFGWIFLFFSGSFLANFIVINLGNRKRSMAHSIPLVLEIICLSVVGIYGQFFYQETLTETELLLALMLFAMGLQNGLTASISNFAIKTTHLTGLMTDLGILFSMFTKENYRRNQELRDKAKLLLVIVSSYLVGGIVAGSIYLKASFLVFHIVSVILLFIVVYDYYKLKSKIRVKKKKLFSIRSKFHAALHNEQVSYTKREQPAEG